MGVYAMLMYQKTHTVKMLIPFKMIQWNSIDSIVSQSTSVAGSVSIVFVKNGQLFLKIMSKCKKLRIFPQKNLKKTLKNLLMRYQDLFISTLIKTLQYWYTGRQICQQKTIEGLKINLYIHYHLISDRFSAVQSGNNGFFRSGTGSIGNYYGKK